MCPSSEKLRDAINSHDPKRVSACFTVDFRQERPLRPSEDFVGRDQVEENWAKIFGAMPDIEAELLRTAVSSEETWGEWEMRATGPGGAPVVLRGPTILTEKGGLIDWVRFYVDPVGHDG